MTRQRAWKLVRGWKKWKEAQRKDGQQFKLGEMERLKVDYVMFFFNQKSQSRASYGSIKKAVLRYAKTECSTFSVDDLMAWEKLPRRVTRKNLVSDLDSLCRRGFIRCVTPSIRGRSGEPRVYAVVAKGDNRA